MTARGGGYCHTSRACDICGETFAPFPGDVRSQCRPCSIKLRLGLSFDLSPEEVDALVIKMMDAVWLEVLWNGDQ